MSVASETVDVALSLLRRMAEDPLAPPSYRVAARRHLRRLAEESAPVRPDDWDQA